MPPQTSHLNLNKLPKEEELRVYMDSLEIEDPYRFPENHVKSIEDMISERDSCLDLDNTVCSEIFRDPSLKPKLHNTGPIRAMVTPYQENSDHLWNRMAASFKTSWSRLENMAKESHFSKISSGHQLSYITHGWRSAIQGFQTYQNYRFVGALHDAGLVMLLTDPMLREEIKLRKKQYPNQKIYTFVGPGFAEYCNGVGIGHELEGSLVIEADRYTPYAIPNDWSFPQYHSAVVAQQQVRTNYSFHYNYELEKIPRWWKIQFWMYQKFAIKVDPHRTTVEVIKEGPPPTTRFSMIEM